MVASSDLPEGSDGEDMTAYVVVPYADYTIPVERPYETISTYPVTGALLINATDYLLINATDKLLIRGSAIASPFIPVPFADYTIPVPKPEWA